MKRLSDLRVVLDDYLAGRKPFSTVRRFVYEYYEADSGVVLDRDLDVLFPILAPYIEYEEAHGDPLRDGAYASGSHDAGPRCGIT